VVGELPVLPDRRWDIDWLRTAAVLLLVPYHTARLFDTWDPFYVKNQQLSDGLSHWLIPLGAAVGMQLLFLLSGSATWLALRVRRARRYAGERFLRLLVPFVFGVLILVPPQTYLGLRSHTGYDESFLAYYPRFFEFHPDDFEGYTQGGLTPAHLWFILFLFLFALVSLPLFLSLRRPAGQRLTAALGSVFARPGMLLLLAVPFIVLERLLDRYEDPLLMFAYFLAFFWLGYLLMADRRFDEAIDRHKRTALLLGPVLWIVLRAIPAAAQPDWLTDTLGGVYNRGFFTWFTIIAVLGYGRKYLTRPNQLLGYFGEAAYPFYIIHQTVLVAVGFLVVQWETGIAVKYLTVALATYVATTLTYELLVRRLRITRFLFGLKPRRTARASGAST
jgi:hypothetical protein